MKTKQTLLILSVLLAAAGCASSQSEPGTLITSRQMLESPQADALQKKYPNLIKEAQSALKKAEAAYDNGDYEEANLYATIASSKFKAASNLSEANQYQGLRKAMNRASYALSDELYSVRNEANLVQRYNQLRNQFESATTQLEKYQGENHEARTELAAARKLQGEALEKGAAAVTPNQYGQGQLFVESALQQLQFGNVKGSITFSKNAQEVFREAIKQTNESAIAQRRAEEAKKEEEKASKETRETALAAIDKAVSVRAQALEKGGDNRRSGVFDKGDFALEEARLAIEQGRYTRAIKMAEEADKSYVQAQDKSGLIEAPQKPAPAAEEPVVVVAAPVVTPQTSEAQTPVTQTQPQQPVVVQPQGQPQPQYPEQVAVQAETFTPQSTGVTPSQSTQSDEVEEVILAVEPVAPTQQGAVAQQNQDAGKSTQDLPYALQPVQTEPWYTGHPQQQQQQVRRPAAQQPQSAQGAQSVAQVQPTSPVPPQWQQYQERRHQSSAYRRRGGRNEDRFRERVLNKLDDAQLERATLIGEGAEDICAYRLDEFDALIQVAESRFAAQDYASAYEMVIRALERIRSCARESAQQAYTSEPSASRSTKRSDKKIASRSQRSKPSTASSNYQEVTPRKSAVARTEETSQGVDADDEEATSGKKSQRAAAQQTSSLESSKSTAKSEEEPQLDPLQEGARRQAVAQITDASVALAKAEADTRNEGNTRLNSAKLQYKEAVRSFEKDDFAQAIVNAQSAIDMIGAIATDRELAQKQAEEDAKAKEEAQKLISPPTPTVEPQPQEEVAQTSQDQVTPTRRQTQQPIAPEVVEVEPRVVVREEIVEVPPAGSEPAKKAKVQIAEGEEVVKAAGPQTKEEPQVCVANQALIDMINQKRATTSTTANVNKLIDSGNMLNQAGQCKSAALFYNEAVDALFAPPKQKVSQKETPAPARPAPATPAQPQQAARSNGVQPRATTAKEQPYVIVVDASGSQNQQPAQEQPTQPAPPAQPAQPAQKTASTSAALTPAQRQDAAAQTTAKKKATTGKVQAGTVKQRIDQAKKAEASAKEINSNDPSFVIGQRLLRLAEGHFSSKSYESAMSLADQSIGSFQAVSKAKEVKKTSATVMPTEQYRREYNMVLDALIARDRAQDRVSPETQSVFDRGVDFLTKARRSWSQKDYVGAGRMAKEAKVEFDSIEAPPPPVDNSAELEAARKKEEEERKRAEEAKKKAAAQQALMDAKTQALAALQDARQAKRDCDAESCKTRDPRAYNDGVGRVTDAETAFSADQFDVVVTSAKDAIAKFNAAKAQKLPVEPNSPYLSRNGDQLVLRPRLMFDTGKSTLSSQSIPSLDAAAEFFKQFGSRITSITINGYTDSRGNAAKNQALSAERADSVLRGLKAKGVDIQMKSHGFGSANPIASNKTRSGREENRRVEIRFTTTED